MAKFTAITLGYRASGASVPAALKALRDILTDKKNQPLEGIRLIPAQAWTDETPPKLVRDVLIDRRSGKISPR